ncbi:cytochrome P450 [Laetiporus sulphureus 93-53]|uniref:Cytochrome P450 n=1 Tax=Laetiporus sulphureus 93-53 TaxID=1314785 RepID=A0A165CQ18_9APHY|nr:cytochrome P450 [Laetiporus sulphureus 93-53]KZT03211.1 cytochrome P450 [Laetiporus sulphureus 93-53]
MKYLTDVVVTLALLSLVVWLYSFSSPRKKSPLFPGPDPLPIIGNVHQVTDDYQHKTFTQWAKEYGNHCSLCFQAQSTHLTYLRSYSLCAILSQPELVLHSVAANDLMEKRGAIYSSRPPLVFLRELLGLDTSPVLLPYGDQWRMDRKFIGALSMDITYGHVALSLEDDKFIRLAAKAAVEAAEAGSVAATLVDFLPMRSSPACCVLWTSTDVKEAVASGSARPSFVSSLLDNLSTDRELTRDDERNIAGVAAALYTAGTDTSATTLETFILAMMLYPDICKKAQAEIDQVIGTSRLPDFSDRSSLPYLERVLLEVYRAYLDSWNCPLPLGTLNQFKTAAVAYSSTKRYHIAKLLTTSISIVTFRKEQSLYPIYGMNHADLLDVPHLQVTPCHRCMTRDADIFPNPETFRPERFETMTAQTIHLYDSRKIVFGHGRRICPGRQLADSSVWLAMANILACFNISKPQGGFSNDATFTPTFSPGVIRNPETSDVAELGINKQRGRTTFSLVQEQMYTTYEHMERKLVKTGDE